MTEVPRQLEMRRPNLDALPALQVPEGCALRTYQEGDADHWARIMNDCIGQGWTARRCLAELVERPEFSPDGCFIATVEGVPQASATAWRKPPENWVTGYVHMVGAAPQARGRGLGYLTTLAALHWFREHGFRNSVLHTDDWRLPAISIYLKLGFEPVLFNAHHTERWNLVGQKLQERR